MSTIAADIEPTARRSTTTVLKSVCRSCHGGCSTLMHVKDGRLVKVEGDREVAAQSRPALSDRHGDGRARLSSRSIEISAAARGAARLRQWERISWDEALDEIAEAPRRSAREFGPESIAMGTGTGPPSHPLGVALRPCARHAELVRAGLRPVLSPARQHLHSDLRRFPGVRFHRRHAARLHDVLGPQSAQFGPGRRDAVQCPRSARRQSENHRRRSARDRARKKAEVWLQLRPGTDDALALAFLNVIIEEDLYDTTSRELDARLQGARRACAQLHARVGRADHLGGGRQDPGGRAPVRDASSPRCWSGAARSSTRRTASRRSARCR